MSSLPPPKAMVFDWDNTLVDTFPTIHAALNVVQEAMGVEKWTLEEAHVKVRQSVRDVFPVMFGDRWEEAREIFYRAFEDVHLRELRVLPGAEDLFDHLRAAGVTLSVVSNKTARYLRREAEHLGWSARFHRVVGATDAARDKPAPDPVHLSLQGAGVMAGPEVWFVGDTDIDLECAHHAGCVPVLVRKSPPLPGEFPAFPPILHVHDLFELKTLVKRN
ncbi:MAG: Phosphoglycolate phosphatase [Alphaproteobacteria bacterium]|nr:Phosphoglycolate phosphatase [Alphaproteobacteria bacterium]